MKYKLSQLTIICGLLATTPISAEEFHFSNTANNATDTLVVFKHKDHSTNQFSHYDNLTKGQLTKALNASDFDGSFGKFVEILAPNNLAHDRIIVVGLGDKDLAKNKLTKLGGNLSGKLEKKQINNISIAADDITSTQAAYIAHGINLRSYGYDKYKKEKRVEKNYHFDVVNEKETQAIYNPLSNIEQGVFLARDLTSEIATEMTPVAFANEAKKLKKLGVEIKILTPKELKKLGMGALEGVGRGSIEGARLVVAHYQGSKDAPIAIAGKGITFDSGGYNIKTSSSIAHMKVDMAGAAAALGTIKALALNETKINVVAVMGMAANMVSEKSIAPGDVLRTAEGISVEIANTDAEGRLVLSDAMWYAREKFKPQILVDMATLTGSKVRAVGNDYAAVFSKDEELIKELSFAGKQVNEKLWRLPLDYKEKLKSDIADIRNTGTGGPGASTAASFLEHFAGDTKWAHIDIAGNALASSAKGETPKGGTGYGVRLLTEWLMNKAK